MMSTTPKRRCALVAVLASAPLVGLGIPSASSASAPINVNASPTGTPSAQGWYDGPQQVVIDVTAESVLSGEWTTTSSAGQRTGTLDVGNTEVMVDTEGATTVAWSVTGNDGRQAQGSIVVRVDATDPVIEVFSLADHAQVPQGSELPLTFRCTDAITFAVTCTDGQGNASGAAIDTTTRGSKTATVTAVDAAGRTSIRTVPYAVIAPDTTPPVVSGRLTGGARGDNGWYRGRYVFETRAVDPVVDHEVRSGLNLLHTQIDGEMTNTTLSTRAVVLTDGRHTFSWAATDRAGNPSVVKSVTANVDDTSPQVTPTYPAEGQHITPQSPARSTTSCFDATSGIARCTTPLLDLAPGPHTLITEARDRAGNAYTQYSGYVVDAPTVTTIDAADLHADRRGVVTVSVAAQVPVYGDGDVYWGSTRIASFSGQRSGSALTKTFRVPVRAIRAGSQTITVKYLGTDGGLPSQATTIIKVK